MSTVTLHLLDSEVVEVSGRYGQRPERLSWYEVRLDGKPVGGVAREMIVRDRKSRGNRYVHARWESPGWQSGTGHAGRYGGSRSECYTREQGVRELLRGVNVDWHDAKNLAHDAKVVKTVTSSS